VQLKLKDGKADGKPLKTSEIQCNKDLRMLGGLCKAEGKKQAAPYSRDGKECLEAQRLELGLD